MAYCKSSPGKLYQLLDFIASPTFFFFKLNNFIYLFLAVLSLLCWVGFSLIVASYSLVGVHRFLIVVASLVAEHEL